MVGQRKDRCGAVELPVLFQVPAGFIYRMPFFRAFRSARFNQVPRNAGEFLQVGSQPARETTKSQRRFNSSARICWAFDVQLTPKASATPLHHFDLFSDRIDQVELTVGEKYRQRNPRKPAAGSPSITRVPATKTDHLSDPKTRKHVPLVRVLHVLPRHHIDLRVPLTVQLRKAASGHVAVASVRRNSVRGEAAGRGDEGRGDEGRGTWDVGRGTWDEVRGTRCEAGVTSIQLLVTSYQLPVTNSQPETRLPAEAF